MGTTEILRFVGGLCLFLFGMNLMGESLEKSAGSRLKVLVARLTTGKIAGFFTGLGVTSVIQSSSATTVMVVGFVNSSIMTLKQSINVIMGANVGTTVTPWILSLSGVKGDAWYVRILKPSSFAPILALIGIVLYMMSKSNKKKDIGVILLGFAILMFGMDTMSDSVSGLKDVPEFTNILTMFSNPFLGVLAGAFITAIIQSSSASVGILQALSSTGAISLGSAISIIMGQNIGTCVTALISSVGANRNARRASIVHLFFNIIGAVILLSLFTVANAIFDFAFVDLRASQVTIAIIHTVFNLLCTAIMLPLTGMLEKISYLLIKEPNTDFEEENIELDERLMTTPAIAIERCRLLTNEMAKLSVDALKDSLRQIKNVTPDLASKIREDESKVDHYEDILGSYLVKLNTYPMNDNDSNESGKLLFCIGDLERICDHAVNILESAEEIKAKKIIFSQQAKGEMNTMTSAIEEITTLAYLALRNSDLSAATKVEPLEQVVDSLKKQLRTRHILRLKNGESSIEAGFVWSDILTNLERVADHCSNIAGCIIEMQHESRQVHEYLNKIKTQAPQFREMYEIYSKKYALVSE